MDTSDVTGLTGWLYRVEAGACYAENESNVGRQQNYQWFCNQKLFGYVPLETGGAGGACKWMRSNPKTMISVSPQWWGKIEPSEYDKNIQYIKLCLFIHLTFPPIDGIFQHSVFSLFYGVTFLDKTQKEEAGSRDHVCRSICKIIICFVIKIGNIQVFIRK